ncbi:hypothetical protein H0266_18440 [Halobacillus locisalis]|uniref:Uncharacterized protein n=1 Tax=Halobacillus locisalis TaxID=220753 RepID=A0A838CXJ3_9BACI|nr:hypothetical protein [Halobacillus locisalis]MBA2176862.1 hypothetical protein [Halobacillus locisalis]
MKLQKGIRVWETITFVLSICYVPLSIGFFIVAAINSSDSTDFSTFFGVGLTVLGLAFALFQITMSKKQAELTDEQNATKQREIISGLEKQVESLTSEVTKLIERIESKEFKNEVHTKNHYSMITHKITKKKEE